MLSCLQCLCGMVCCTSCCCRRYQQRLVGQLHPQQGAASTSNIPGTTSTLLPLPLVMVEWEPRLLPITTYSSSFLCSCSCSSKLHKCRAHRLYQPQYQRHACIQW